MTCRSMPRSPASAASSKKITGTASAPWISTRSWYSARIALWARPCWPRWNGSSSTTPCRPPSSPWCTGAAAFPTRTRRTSWPGWPRPAKPTTPRTPLPNMPTSPSSPSPTACPWTKPRWPWARPCSMTPACRPTAPWPAPPAMPWTRPARTTPASPRASASSWAM